MRPSSSRQAIHKRSSPGLKKCTGCFFLFKGMCAFIEEACRPVLTTWKIPPRVHKNGLELGPMKLMFAYLFPGTPGIRHQIPLVEIYRQTKFQPEGASFACLRTRVPFDSHFLTYLPPERKGKGREGASISTITCVDFDSFLQRR